MSLSQLPQELLDQIFSLLPVKTLIVARSVCKSFLATSHSPDIHPTRRALLAIYLRHVKSPSFCHTRQRVYPFNASQCLQAWDPVPEELEFFLREWPERASIGHMWPGLEYPGMGGAEALFPRSANVLPTTTKAILPLRFPEDQKVLELEDLELKRAGWSTPKKTSASGQVLWELEVDAIHVARERGLQHSLLLVNGAGYYNGTVWKFDHANWEFGRSCVDRGGVGQKCMNWMEFMESYRKERDIKWQKERTWRERGRKTLGQVTTVALSLMLA